MQLLTTHQAPELVSKLATLASADTTDLKEAGKLLDHHDDFARQLVEAARSSVMGLDQTVRSPREAFEALGPVTTLELAVCHAVIGHAPSDSLYPVARFFDLSLRRAVAAQLVAPLVGLDGGFEIFAMGFCQDVGLLLLIDQESHLAAELGKLSSRPSWIRREAERSYGTAHDEYSKDLMVSWGLPESFSAPHEHHHDAPAAPPTNQKLA